MVEGRMRAEGSYAGLTKLQADLLSFLRTAEADQETPSFQQMADALRLSSKSGIARLITALEERGYVERIPNRARAIWVVPDHVHRSGPLERASVSELIAALETRGLTVAIS